MLGFCDSVRLGWRRCKWQGPFAPRTLLRFIATTDPSATLSPSADFPGSPVIRPTLLRRFLVGTRRASPVAQHVLVTVLSLPPRRGEQPYRSVFRLVILPSPYGCRLGPRGYSFSRPQCVHCCYGPVTRNLPSGGLVDRLRRFSFHLLRYPNYGALTSTPAGLFPAEHASLRWTHNRTRASRLIRLPMFGRRHTAGANGQRELGGLGRPEQTSPVPPRSARGAACTYSGPSGSGRRLSAAGFGAMPICRNGRSS